MKFKLPLRSISKWAATSFVVKSLFVLLLTCCLLPVRSFAHTVDNFTSCNTFCVGSTVTVTVRISATNNSTKYNWQYRDNSNTWKCFQNGNNTINGVVFVVSNATATGIKTQLSLSIANAKSALDGVDIRLLMADNGSPCNNPSYATWGANKSQELDIVTNCSSVANLCHTGCNNNCNHTTCGHSNCAHNSCNNDCNHTNCGHANCGKHTNCNNNCNHTTCGHANCSHNSCNNNNCNHTGCGHPNCGHNNCHNDCNHTGCGHLNCGHNSCNNDCTHTGCGHSNCGHNNCHNDCNHSGCGHTNCGNLTLGNQVWNDFDGDGKRDLNEPGIAGATISLYRDNNSDNLPDGAAIRTTQSDQNGRYLFTGLPEGRYIVSMPILPGYQKSPNTSTQDTSPFPDNNIDNDNNLVRLVGPNGPGGVMYSNAITLTTGQEPTTDGDGANGNLTMDLAECGNAAIGDFVWKDLNGNGIQDAGEPGINDVLVRITFSDGRFAEELTHNYNGTDGYYDFINLGPGTYIISFPTPAGLVPSPANQGGNDAKDSDPVNGSVSVTLAANQSNFTIDAGFRNPPPPPGNLRLGNQVWNDFDGDGKRDANEPGIGGVTISLYTDNDGDNLPDGEAIKTTMSDSKGLYLFTGLQPGRYIASMPILLGYQQSPNTTTGGIVGALQPGCCSLDPDANIDNDNNLVRLVGPNAPGGIVYTNAITLTEGQEPTTDGDDANGNLTFDLAQCGNSWIGDFVWNDLNANGIQDAGEPGINGVLVKITFEDGTTATTTTHTYNAANNQNAPEFDGYYDFKNLGPGRYIITFETPAGLSPSPANQGNNDAKDSDPVNGSATVTLAANQSDFTIDAGFTNKSICVATSCVQWKFNTVACAPNRFVWFNSTLKVTGKTSSPTTIYISNGSITFRANGQNYNLAVPKSQITFSTSVTTAKTYFNTASQTWEIEVPYNTTGDVFAGGLTFPVPVSGLPANVNPVKWCADFSATTPGLTVKWEWAAALYSSFSNNYNNLVVATVDGYNQAGTPVAYKNKLVAGGTGSGGNNCTGTKTPSGTVTPCANPTVSLGNFVWNDYDGDGKKDPNEYGLPGITVRLYRAGTPGVFLPRNEAIATTVTNSQGFYHFDNLPEGQYYTSMTIPLGYQRSPNSSTTTGETPDNNVDNDNNARFPVTAQTGDEIYTAPITLTAGAEPTDDGDGADGNNTLDLAVCGNFWIGDFVWNDVNGNGIQDAGENGINGVKVHILFPDGVTTSEVTTYTYLGNDGYYDFPRLGPGTFKLTFETPAGFHASPANQGGDDTKDSDPVGGTVTVVLVDKSNMDVDAGFNNKPIECPGSTGSTGYFGGFEAGANNISPTTGKSDFVNNGLPNIGSYKIVSSVSELNGSGYLNVQPRNGNYFLAARTTADVTDKIWYTKIAVTPGQTVSFCIYATLLKSATILTPTYLGLYANGTSLTSARVTSNWTSICGTYTVPDGVTTLELSIRDPKKGCFFVAIDDICISQASTLSLGNFVWNDYDGDGKKDPNEYGIGGIKVSLYRDDDNDNRPDTEEPIATTNTNMFGFYKFSNLREGKYITSIPILPGYQRSPNSTTTTNATPDNNVDGDNNAVWPEDAATGDEIYTNSITLTEGGESTTDGDGANGNNTLDMALCGNLFIGNFVWNDANGNGIQDAGEKGINGAEVKILFPDGTTATTLTHTYADAEHPSVDDDGYYDFPNLGPGRYVLYFTTPAGLTPSPVNRANDSLDSDPILGLVIVNLTTESNLNVDAGFTDKHSGCHNNCNHENCGHSYCSHNSCNNNCNHTNCGHSNCSHNNCHNNCNHSGCGHSNCGSNLRTVHTSTPSTICNMVVKVEGKDPLCYNNRTGNITSTVTGNLGALVYTWSNGSTGENLANIGAGSYTLTVKDKTTGCQVTTDPVVLNNPRKLMAHLSSPSVNGYNLCKDANNGTIELKVAGGTGNYTYEWSNGATTQNLQGVPAGKYSVVVKDESKCPAEASIVLKEALNSLQVESTVHTITCNNPKAAIDLKVAGGVAPYQYSWSNHSTATSVSNIDAGNYSVKVQDAMGCEVVKNFQIANYNLDVKVTADKNTLYAGTDNGTRLNAEASGGSAPYKYTWTNDASLTAANEKATVSPAATTGYTVTVTDATGCTATANTSVKVVADATAAKQKPAPEVVVEGIKVMPNPSNGVFTVWLNGFENGSVDLRIVDVSGKEVNSRQVMISSKQQAVSYNVKLPRGMYFVNAVSPGGSFQEKLLIKY